jgi:hypothetical protein
LEPDDPPPQPLIRLRAKPNTASSTSIRKRRRFQQPRQHAETTRAEPGSSGQELRWSAWVLVEAEKVSVVEIEPPGRGVTLAGEKLHDAPAGSPEQVNATVEPAVLTVGIRSVTSVLLRLGAHFPGPSPNSRHASRGRENRR